MYCTTTMDINTDLGDHSMEKDITQRKSVFLAQTTRHIVHYNLGEADGQADNEAHDDGKGKPRAQKARHTTESQSTTHTFLFVPSVAAHEEHAECENHHIPPPKVVVAHRIKAVSHVVVAVVPAQDVLRHVSALMPAPHQNRRTMRLL